MTSHFIDVHSQKSRLARIRVATNNSRSAFINSKKKAEQRLLALQSELTSEQQLNDGDVFQLQHHHLLACLERTTVGMGYSKEN